MDRRTWTVTALGALLAVSFFRACVSEDPGSPLATPDSGSPDTATNEGGPDLCAEYCDRVFETCIEENRAFDNREDCRAMCAFLPQGSDGDKSNSVACRLPHARTGGGKETCKSASAYGGGVCGLRCDVFCDLVDKNCIQPLGAERAPYPDKSSCKEACEKMTYDPDGGEGSDKQADGRDTLNCRMYHLILSLGTGRNTHCPHTAVASDVCRPPPGEAGD